MPVLRATDRSGRLVGVDLARFAALAGMAATHLFPAFQPDGSLHPAYAVAAGRAAALFAVLAGVSLALASGGRTPPRDKALWSARAGVTARAAFLLALGVALGAVESPPLVILAYYALLFPVAAAFLGLPARTLAVLAAGSAVVTPVASHLLRQHLPVAPVEEPANPHLLTELLVTGTYPVLTWTTYVIAGLALGRSDLHRIGTAARLLVVGVGVAVLAKVLASLLLRSAGGEDALGGYSGGVHDGLARGLFGVTPRGDWHWLLVAAPHTGAPLDLAHTVGTSMAVLGAALLLARLAPKAALLPLMAAGSMTLTLYTAHVLVLAEDSPWHMDDPFVFWLVQLAVALVVATLWRTRLGRGPLEAVSSLLDRTARGAVQGRSRSRAAKL